ncbi:unnamed protein product [Ophioblennius macclurei]
MNTTLRHWKEAATLILVAGHKAGMDSSSSRTPLVAAPLVAASGAPQDMDGRTYLPHGSRFDYSVLMLKRSGKSGFMPNAYVFPGGMLDSSDFSSDWIDIFISVSSSPTFGLRSVKQPRDTRPPIFATDRHKLGSPIPGEVALRICALRETFEESGVLLVVPQKKDRSVLKCMEELTVSDSQLCSTELSKWRALVNKKPSNFVKMCRELQVLPNIWALHEWGNWLTPKGRYGGTRFDTAFFICCLQDIPVTLQDQREIVRYQWSTPSDVLQSYQSQELWIAPPQFYELSRLCRFPSLSDLHKFSCQRATEGCEQWMPMIVLQDNHSISLLPGDKLYSSAPSEEVKIEQSSDRVSDSQEESALHRLVISDPYSLTLQVTITPKFNHLLPVMNPTFSHDSKSQL